MGKVKTVKHNHSFSKNLLKLKFMTRSTGHIEKRCPIRRTRVPKSSSSDVVVEPSWTICEELMLPRRSYGGMNVEVEREMSIQEDRKDNVKVLDNVKQENSIDVDVTAEEMATLHRKKNSIIKAIAKKFGKGKKRTSTETVNHPDSKSKRKFWKPNDD